MTDEEQKRIFSNNLNRYIPLNQKQQIDVAKDLGINPTTFNMCIKEIQCLMLVRFRN